MLRRGNGSRVKGTWARCCPYADVGVVNWIGGIQVSPQQNKGRLCTTPTQERTCTWVALRKGLDGTFSVVSAQPAGPAA
jgi:hypothetical protein